MVDSGLGSTAVATAKSAAAWRNRAAFEGIETAIHSNAPIAAARARRKTAKLFPVPTMMIKATEARTASSAPTDLSSTRGAAPEVSSAKMVVIVAIVITTV